MKYGSLALSLPGFASSIRAQLSIREQLIQQSARPFGDFRRGHADGGLLCGQCFALGVVYALLWWVVAALQRESV